MLENNNKGSEYILLNEKIKKIQQDVEDLSNMVEKKNR